MMPSAAGERQMFPRQMKSILCFILMFCFACKGSKILLLVGKNQQ